MISSTQKLLGLFLKQQYELKFTNHHSVDRTTFTETKQIMSVEGYAMLIQVLSKLEVPACPITVSMHEVHHLSGPLHRIGISFRITHGLHSTTQLVDI